MFSLGTIILLVIAAADLLIGIFVFTKNRRRLVNGMFAVFTFGASFWIASVALLFATHRLFFSDLVFVGGTFTFLGLFLFAYTFVRQDLVLRQLLPWTLPAFMILMLTPFRLFVSDVALSSGGMLIPVNGPGIPLFVAMGAGYVFGTLFHLVRGYRRSSGIMRRQFEYLLVGAAVFIVSALIFNTILPAFGIFRFNILGPAASVIFLAMTAYAIVRYQLLDIRVVFQRGALYTGFVTTVLGVYFLTLLLIGGAFSDEFAPPIAAAAAATIVVLTYQPIDGFLRRITDNLLYKNHYDVSAAVGMTGELLNSALQDEEAFHRLALLLQKTLKAGSVHILRCQKDGMAVVGSLQRERTEKDEELESLFAENAVDCHTGTFRGSGGNRRLRLTQILSRETTERGDLYPVFEKGNLALLVPVMKREHFTGLLVLGPKRSGERYAPDDLHFLEVVSHQVAIALENAELYARQRAYAKGLEEEVANRTKEIVELHRKQMALVQDLSHGLQTPMAILRNSLDSAERKGDVDVVALRKIADRLTLTIRRLLRLAVEEHVSYRERTKLNLCPLLHDLAEQITVISEDKGVQFRSVFSGHREDDVCPGMFVLGDPVEFREVFSELLANAVKHTPRGGEVTLSVQHKDREAVIRVEDTGSGIKEEHLPHIFERFYRSGEHGEQGTGLGLAIVQSIVKAHGGEVGVTSTEGAGSTFSVRLPTVDPSETPGA